MIGFDDAALTGIIVGLVQLAKETGLPARWAPLLSLALGVAAGIFVVSPGDVVQGILAGVAMGLAAVGLFSGVKNVAKGSGTNG